MDTTYSWAEVREAAVDSFGGSYPNAETEQQVLDVFRERPAFVVAVIEDVAQGYKAGRINSPWGFLRTQLDRAPADVVVADGSERERKVSNARQWMRAAGMYLEDEQELRDELFGDRGTLRAWAADQSLVDEMIALWQSVRPEGERLETEAAERIAHQVATLRKLGAPAQEAAQSVRALLKTDPPEGGSVEGWSAG